METLVRQIRVVPHWMCRPGVERPDVVRRRTVQTAIDEDRSGLSLRGVARFERPYERKLVDVRRRNLRQAAVGLAGVRAEIRWPTVDRRIQECSRIRRLSQGRTLERKQRNQDHRETAPVASKLHFLQFLLTKSAYSIAS